MTVTSDNDQPEGPTEGPTEAMMMVGAVPSTAKETDRLVDNLYKSEPEEHVAPAHEKPKPPIACLLAFQSFSVKERKDDLLIVAKHTYIQSHDRGDVAFVCERAKERKNDLLIVA